MSEFAVEALDPHGDGVFATPTGRRTAPLALPGDRVRLDDGEMTVLPRSTRRVAPPCPVFGACGGCRMLHAADALYADWKAGLLREAFAAAGLAPPIAPMARSALPSRRRITLSARQERGGVRAGYFTRASHDIVDVTACPALEPALDAALPAIRAIAVRAAQHAGEARLTATLCDNGVDVALAAGPTPTRGRGKRRRGAAPEPPPTLDHPSLIRLSRAGEVLLAREEPVIAFDGVPVPFPPGAFIQATRAGEAALVAAVRAGVGEAGTVLDAFCGLGTFALPLSRMAEVTAVDVDGPAIAALEAAARHVRGRRPLTAVRRDLLRHPMGPQELKRFAAVVFDPPRAGAKGLAEALAASDVPTVVAVSCEPRTLARDCAILHGAGYEIATVQPVDQFVATTHIEAVATLRRRP